MLYIHQILEKKWEYSEAVHHLFEDFKKAYDSVRGEIYNIFIDFSIPMKLAITMCLHEMYSLIWVDKHLSDMYPIRNSLNK